MNEYNLWLMITILTVSQGVFLSLAILFKSRKNHAAHVLLSIFVFLIALTMLGRLSFYFSASEDTFLPGGLVDIIIFCFGPLSYFYLKSLLYEHNSFKGRDWLHAVPLAIYFIYFFHRLLFPAHFEASIFYTRLDLVFFFLELLAIVQNIVYAYWGYNIVRDYETGMAKEFSLLPQIRYIKIFLVVVSVILLLWSFGFFSKTFFGYQTTTIISYNLTWILISCLTFLLAYFSYFDSDLLSVPQKQVKYEQGYFSDEYYLELKAALEAVMVENKPYLNPQLTLSELADQMDKNPRDLSRVINEHFGQNFYEFVNKYRVDHFKSLLAANKHKDFTLLSLAYESGFNSKATFNAVFKKLTSSTPSQYIQGLSAS